ncbi:MAG: ORF6N domain-containing protein [Pirellulales bacterium]
MAKKQSQSLVPAETIEQSILVIRGHKVLLDFDLARLYGVTTKALVQAVQRNKNRFPAEFAFRLTAQEFAALRSQNVTLKGDPLNRSQFVTGSQKHRDPRYAPFAFTEQGIAMLSSVLRSGRAVAVNIEIMRAFVRLRSILAFNAELAGRLDEVEKHLGHHDQQFIEVIRAIRQLMQPPPRPLRRRIGFDVQRERTTDAKLPTASGKAKRALDNPRRNVRSLCQLFRRCALMTFSGIGTISAR